jgi:hypothetical protein
VSFLTLPYIRAIATLVNLDNTVNSYLTMKGKAPWQILIIAVIQ